MASADWLPGLWRMLADTTLAGSLAIALVFALRGRVRAMFGANHAYLLWTLVPVVMLAVSLPSAAHVTVVPTSVALAAVPLRARLAQLPVVGNDDLRLLLCATWLTGLVVAVAWLAWRERQFRRGLGRLHRRGAFVYRADATHGLPATLGIWRPRVVLPADFTLRYDRVQRALMLDHERLHIARGDLQTNAVVAVLRCLFWFNPLVQLAIPCFRHDQELACDAAVIARHPHARRGYGELLMQVQLAAQPSLLGCHLGFGHPLKERISMLAQPFPSTLRRFAGLALVVTLVSGVGMGARAMAPEASSDQLIDVRLGVQIDGKTVATPRIINRSGQPFSVSDGTYRFEMTATVRPDGKIALAGKPTWDGETLGEIKVDLVDGTQEAFDFRAPRGGSTVVVTVDASTAPDRLVLSSGEAAR